MKVKKNCMQKVFMIIVYVYFFIVYGCGEQNPAVEGDQEELGYFCQCDLSVEKESSSRLVASGNKWNLHFDRTGYAPSTIDDYTNVLTIEDETVIDGVSYFSLMQTTDSAASKRKDSGYIREDTFAKKVYYLEVGKPERVLYDFSLNEGDSITYDYPWYYPEKDDVVKTVIIAEDVNSVLIGGELRKQITVRVKLIFNGEFRSRKHVWIEGIGATDDFFQDYARYLLVGAYGRRLLCFFQNEKLVYKNFPPDRTIPLMVFDETIIIPQKDCCYFWRSWKYDEVEAVWKFLEISGK